VGSIVSSGIHGLLGLCLRVLKVKLMPQIFWFGFGLANSFTFVWSGSGSCAKYCGFSPSSNSGSCSRLAIVLG
jgi:hypothetical protein